VCVVVALTLLVFFVFPDLDSCWEMHTLLGYGCVQLAARRVERHLAWLWTGLSLMCCWGWEVMLVRYWAPLILILQCRSRHSTSVA
jgi:hypothetical protein